MNKDEALKYAIEVLRKVMPYVDRDRDGDFSYFTGKEIIDGRSYDMFQDLREDIAMLEKVANGE